MHIFNSLLLYLEIYLEVELMGHQEWKFSTYLDKSNYLCKFSLHHLLPILDILSVLIFTSLVDEYYPFKIILIWIYFIVIEVK